jgi:hypothetical protein
LLASVKHSTIDRHQAGSTGGWWWLVKLRAIAVAALLAACAVLTACGGSGSGNDKTPEGSPTATPGNADPVSVATVENGRFINPTLGYAVTIPPGWSSDDDFIKAPNMRGDGFFGRQAGPPPDIQPSILVQCETSVDQVDTQAYAGERISTVERLGATNVSQPITVEVGGSPAVAYEYDLQRSGGLDFHRVDVMWGRGNCGWLISLTTAAKEAADYTDLFTEFVNSYQALDGAGARSGS